MLFKWEIHLELKPNGKQIVLNFCDKGECERMLDWYKKNQRNRFISLKMVELDDE